MSDSIGLKAIEDTKDAEGQEHKGLRGCNFYIPSYQRGYRWTEQQVTDLLNDVWEFMQKKENSTPDAFYCLQPLVVKKIENQWHVIDGQQRLTTIYIILSCLGESKLYSLEYETRPNSKYFLTKIQMEEKDNDNIDYFHMIQTRNTVNDWLNDKVKNTEKKKLESIKEELKKAFLNKVQFIWYETSESDPIKVFTRLNIGKIGLTNAELIKALFLNSSNFSDKNDIRLRQQEIASQWDTIEYTLQNDEFWLFLHDTGYTNPTRIDFIFDLVCEQNLLYTKGKDENASQNGTENSDAVIGTDEYRTFRYFYNYFYPKAEDSKNDSIEKSPEEKLSEAWEKVKTIFQTFEEWFNDLELYHYVGYITAIENEKNNKKNIKDTDSINTLLNKWSENATKELFRTELVKLIKANIKNCSNLNTQYEVKGNPKTKCKPLLLLHNVQTVINQTKTSDSSYRMHTFYKFPFHLYKTESWDVEHIDSNIENDLSDKNGQNEYLLNFYLAGDEETRKKIEKFINNNDSSEKEFNELQKSLKLERNPDPLAPEEKDKILNFTLLDSSTNRSYGNSIFPVKRRIIIGKDKGKYLAIPKISKSNGKTQLNLGEEEEAKSSFIPPCTRNIFLKYYNTISSTPNYWTKTDAEAYLKNIKDTLKDFLPNKDNENE